MTLNFELIIGLFLGIPLLSLIFYWIFTFRKSNSQDARNEKVWECEICLGVYSAFADKEITKCPFCGSYNKEAEK